MGAPLSGSSVAGSIGNAFRLNSDRNRHGQEAFTASPFSRLLVTHVLSLGGDALVTLALAGSIFFSTSLHAARGRVALTLLVTIAPFAVVAPLLGPIIDRAGSRRLMVVVTAIGRGIACLLMARYINSFGLYPAAFVSLVCSKGYIVTKATLVPAAVESPRDLVEANSKLAVSGAIAGFLMAVPGIAILKLASGAWVLRVDALVFAACALSAMRLQTSKPATPEAGRHLDVTSRLSGQAAAEAAAQEVRAKPLPPGAIQVAAFSMGVLRFLVGFLTFLIAFAFRADHAPAWWYGVVLACSIGGNLIGAAAAPWLRSRVREELILAGSAIFVALAGVLALFFNSFSDRPAASLLAGVVGLSAGGAKLAFDAQVQRHIPAANQGRAFGRFEAGFQLVWVFGGLVPVVIPLSLGGGILITAIAAAVASAVYVAGTRMARLGQLPDWWPGVGEARSFFRQRRNPSGPPPPGSAALPGRPGPDSPAGAAGAGAAYPPGWGYPPGSTDPTRQGYGPGSGQGSPPAHGSGAAYAPTTQFSEQRGSAPTWPGTPAPPDHPGGGHHAPPGWSAPLAPPSRPGAAGEAAPWASYAPTRGYPPGAGHWQAPPTEPSRDERPGWRAPPTEPSRDERPGWRAPPTEPSRDDRRGGPRIPYWEASPGEPRDDEERPWLADEDDPAPDVYPPPIAGPPPFSRSGRLIPPPLTGPPPRAFPLGPRPGRPPPAGRPGPEPPPAGRPRPPGPPGRGDVEPGVGEGPGGGVGEGPGGGVGEGPGGGVGEGPGGEADQARE